MSPQPYSIISNVVLHIMDLPILVADYVYKAIDALPVTAHPMTQFASGVMALQVSKLIFSHSFQILVYSFHWSY